MARLEQPRQWRRPAARHLSPWALEPWPGALGAWSPDLCSRPGASGRPEPPGAPRGGAGAELRSQGQEGSCGRAARVLWPCGGTTSPVAARSSCEAASWSVTGSPLIASSRSPTATHAAAVPPGRTPSTTDGRPLAPPVVPRTRHVRPTETGVPPGARRRQEASKARLCQSTCQHRVLPRMRPVLVAASGLTMVTTCASSRFTASANDGCAGNRWLPRFMTTVPVRCT